MKHFVFLLGRPGCGKSVVYKILKDKLHAQGIDAERLDDFLTLKELIAKDTGFNRHVLKDGGFAVTDWSIVDEALQELCGVVKNRRTEKKIIFIEFARNNYQNAFGNFTKDVLGDSVLLYVYSTFEECYKRNVERFKKIQKEGHDDHIVPHDLMRSYYRTDDYEQAYLRSQKELEDMAPAPLMVLDSTVSGEEGIKKLTQQIEERILNKIL